MSAEELIPHSPQCYSPGLTSLKVIMQPGTQITVVLCYKVCVSVPVQGREAIWADPARAECGDDSDHAGYATLVLHGPA